MIRNTNTKKTGRKPASMAASAGRSSRSKSEGRRSAAPKRGFSRNSDSDAPKRSYSRRSDSDAPKRTYSRRSDSDAPKRSYSRRSDSDAPKRSYSRRSDSDAPESSVREEILRMSEASWKAARPFPRAGNLVQRPTPRSLASLRQAERRASASTVS